MSTTNTTRRHLDALYVMYHVGVIPEEHLFDIHSIIFAACRRDLVDSGIDNDTIKEGTTAESPDDIDAVFCATMHVAGELVEFTVDVADFDVEALTHLWDKFKQETITALALIAKPGQNPAITWNQTTVDLRLLGPGDEVQWEINDVPASTLAVLFALRASIHGGSPDVMYWQDRDEVEPSAR